MNSNTHVFNQYPEYAFIVQHENERNKRIVENILKVIADNPNKYILVAIGIDHKYFIEDSLESKGIKVYQANEME